MQERDSLVDLRRVPIHRRRKLVDAYVDVALVEASIAGGAASAAITLACLYAPVLLERGRGEEAGGTFNGSAQQADKS
ncbi:MAG TPA: hypothetical protein VIW78_00520 [Burkholderiales bacterium]